MEKTNERIIKIEYLGNRPRNHLRNHVHQPRIDCSLAGQSLFIHVDPKILHLLHSFFFTGASFPAFLLFFYIKQLNFLSTMAPPSFFFFSNLISRNIDEAKLKISNKLENNRHQSNNVIYKNNQIGDCVTSRAKSNLF